MGVSSVFGSSWKRATVVLSALGSIMVLGLSACGGDDDGADGGGGATDLAAIQDQVDSLLTENGTYGAPPERAPEPEANQKLWLVSGSQAATIISEAMRGAADAATGLGWTSTTFDAKFDPALAADGVRQGIAAGADAIIVYAWDCPLIKQPLKEARAAGITTIGIESLDCSELDPGGEQLFDGVVTYEEGAFSVWVQDQAAAMANYIIVNTDGEAETIFFDSKDTEVVKLLTAGFERAMNECGGCTLHKIPFRQVDIGPKLQELTEQSLVKFPNTNSSQALFDSMITAGIGQALQTAGKTPGDFLSMGVEGDPAVMDLIREGSVQAHAGIGTPSRWEGFAGVDALIRVQGGEEPRSSGIGLQLFDRDHNMPPEGGYQAPVDFETAYFNAWGVGG
jgi:ribose transport system substrate-binding protein